MTQSRRDFLAAFITGGATLGGVVVLRERALALAVVWHDHGGQSPQATALTAWVRIGRDETTRITFARTEMGQGANTALAMLVAEELDADWSRVVVDQASNSRVHGPQDTGGSASVRDGYMPLRRAGATARAMLLSAAAARWGVAASTLRTERGVVIANDGRKLSYGALVESAANQSAPSSVELKSERDFSLIGRNVLRVDVGEKSRGVARFGHDVRLPGMWRAVVRRCPQHGGTVAELDESAARVFRGFKQTLRLTRPWDGVAVLVEGTSWDALRAAEALRIVWAPPATTESSDSMAIKMERARVATWNGTASPPAISMRADAEAVAATPPDLNGSYNVPFAPHLQMEPLTATARPDGDGVEIWAPTQVPRWGVMQVSAATSIPSAQIRIHPTMLGGAFGRRLIADTLSEAAVLARAAGRPVQVVASRADDLAADYFRPPSQQDIRAWLGANGLVARWDHVLAGPSIDWSHGMRMPNRVPEDIGQGFERGVGPYRFPSVRQRWAPVETNIRLGWWRSVGHGVNAFPVEVAMDELAALRGVDPLEFRLAHLTHAPRAQTVLRLAAQRAGWAGPRQPTRAQGLALWDTFGTLVACVAEVSVLPTRHVRVHRVTCAVDCGRVVHPDGARAQIEGGVIFALSSAIYDELRFADGAVVQQGFHDYRIVRLSDAPVVDVHFVASEAPPTGTGEGGVPPVAPAVSNAIFALTGTRLRSLPFRLPPP